MAPRPRKSRYTTTPNLYVKRDARTGKLSCQYKDVRTKKFHGLGSDLEQAEQQARELNVLIGMELLELERKAILELDNSQKITVGKWIEEYIKILEEKVTHGEIKPATLSIMRSTLTPVINDYKNLKLSDLTTMAINKIIKRFVDNGKPVMAQRIRATLVDVFAEAMAAGNFPADKPNPAQVTKRPRSKTKRARLTLEVFNQATAWAKSNQNEYLWRSYLFAAVTGQRLSDINSAKFEQVMSLDDEMYFEFIQAKTGTKVLIPLNLKLNCIDTSVSDVIAMCRDGIESQYLLHHTRNIGHASAGGKIRKGSVTAGFSQAVAALNIDWGDNTPPTFHEIRSLAEREYRKQGVNTQHLLGHKHQAMTDTYADARGHDWIVVKATEK